jgi:hypothetical protein
MISTDELQNLTAEATRGPWHVGKDADDAGGWFVGGGGYCRAVLMGPLADREINARAIATWPDLARELIAARAKIEAAEKLAEAARAAKDSLSFSAIELAAQADIPPEDSEMIDDRLDDLSAALTAYEATK